MIAARVPRAGPLLANCQRRSGTPSRNVGDGIEESIVSKTGETIRIVPDAMDGAVDAVNQQRGYALISGWASDGTHHGPANQVAVFVNSEAGPHAHTVVHRPDLVEGFKTKSLLKAGFEVILPGLVFEARSLPAGAGLRYLGDRGGFRASISPRVRGRLSNPEAGQAVSSADQPIHYYLAEIPSQRDNSDEHTAGMVAAA